MPTTDINKINWPDGNTTILHDSRCDGVSEAVEAILGGGSVDPNGTVNFYDYDGKLVYSYTASKFATLTEMPANPSHDGLAAQGWNWTLSDAKTYVASYGRLNIGQMYTTSDGKTRLYIALTEGRTSPILKLTLASGSEVDIDWGDGTTHDTLSGSGDKTTNRHEYAAAGSYVIAITVSSGSVTIPQYILSNGDPSSSSSSPDKAYLNAIKKVEIGSSVTSIGNSAFQSCYSLSPITIPSSVTSIGDSAFYYCSSLSSITIPSSVTSIGSSAFQNGFSLSSITIPSSVTSIGNSAFRYCSSLSSITIPSSVTSIGSSAFQNCYSLSSITIPSSVTSIGSSAFSSCYSLATINILGKSSGDISGAPWGASTGSPTYTQIIWENAQ